MVKLPNPNRKIPDKNLLSYIFKLGELENLIKSNKRFKRKLNEIKKLEIRNNFTKDFLFDYFEYNKKININFIENMINRIVEYENKLIEVW